MRLFDRNDTISTSHAYYNRGIAWSEKKEYDKAIADYNKALAVDPNNANFYVNRGRPKKRKASSRKPLPTTATQ